MNIDSLCKVKVNPKIPKINPGDTVRVSFKVKEATRERLQVFPGLVIRVRKGNGGGNFTIRRVTSGIGVEHTFPFASQLLEKVEIVRHGKVRRAKLYYMRQLSAKEARLKERREKAEELAISREIEEAEEIEAATEAEAVEEVEPAADAIAQETEEVKEVVAATEAEEAEEVEPAVDAVAQESEEDKQVKAPAGVEEVIEAESSDDVEMTAAVEADTKIEEAEVAEKPEENQELEEPEKAKDAE